MFSHLMTGVFKDWHPIIASLNVVLAAAFNTLQIPSAAAKPLKGRVLNRTFVTTPLVPCL